MKPNFFISSTIYDFKDLRSSIKWWLEENEYLVNASEFNDFEKKLDENSYEACLKTIDNANYFILLIGNRVGGKYDSTTTITQKEYQYAYERMLKGKLKIINFIRYETWIKYNDCNKIIKDDDNKNEMLYNFINEVRRLEEMKEGKKPKNNWLHSFNTFSEIIGVIKQELGSKIGLSYKIDRHILNEEITHNIKQLMQKNDKNNYSSKGSIDNILFKDFKLDMNNQIIKLSENQFFNFANFYLSYWQFKELRKDKIHRLYKSGFFLEYSSIINDYVSGDLNKLARSTISFFDNYNKLHFDFYKDFKETMFQLSKKSDKSHLNVKSLLIFKAITLNDAILNCINYSISLYRALNMDVVEIPVNINNQQYPDGMIEKESIMLNDDDVIKILSNQK